MYQFGNRMMDGSHFRMGLGIVVCLVVLALVVLAIIALIRYIRSTNRDFNTAAHRAVPTATVPPAGATQYGAPVVDSALQILNERYARGELSDEEYRAKKAEILR